MTFVAALNSSQLQQIISSGAAQLVSFLKQFQATDQQLNDMGLSQITQAYAQQYGGAIDATTRAQADLAELTAYLGAVESIVAYATQAVTVTVTDHTGAGATDSSIDVPVGSYALVTSDPTAILILRNLGDKGKLIRSAAPLGA